jgi:hypothetical protein
MYFVAYTVSSRYSSEGNKPLEKSGGSPLQSLPQSCTTLENLKRINIVFTCCTESEKTRREVLGMCFNSGGGVINKETTASVAS